MYTKKKLIGPKPDNVTSCAVRSMSMNDNTSHSASAESAAKLFGQRVDFDFFDDVVFVESRVRHGVVQFAHE